MELFIQLAIIMIGKDEIKNTFGEKVLMRIFWKLGKQAINTIVEIATPWLLKKYRIFRYGKKSTVEEDKLKSANQWTKDFKLTAWSTMGLFQEYLEMVIQFG